MTLALARPADRHWRDHAACPGMDPDLWTITNGSGGTVHPVALATCGTCPVREACHRDAQATSPHLRRSIVLAGVPYNDAGLPLATGLARCARPGCPAWVSVAGIRRYCTAVCRDTTQAARQWARRRAEGSAP